MHGVLTQEEYLIIYSTILDLQIMVVFTILFSQFQIILTSPC